MAFWPWPFKAFTLFGIPALLDLGFDLKSRIKSTSGFGVGSGRFHLGSESNFNGVVCLFDFFKSIYII